jgi:hypothetical protein
MIPFLLWMLATIDAAFAGYRAAAGRSALIDKRAYYRRAMLTGALYGQVAVAIAGLFTAVLTFLSPEPARLMTELEQAGRRMLIVYLPFALIIFLAFAVRAFPSVDIRSITSVLIFGPFTLIRPAVAVAGVLWAVSDAPRLSTVLLGLLILTLMLGLERFLGTLNAGALN